MISQTKKVPKGTCIQTEKVLNKAETTEVGALRNLDTGLLVHTSGKEPAENHISTPKNSHISSKLAYYFLFHSQPAFNSVFVSKLKSFEDRYYQYPMLHSPELIVYGGRSMGKSVCMETRMLLGMFQYPGIDMESVLTSFRRAHVKDRMEGMINIFQSHPYLSLFLRSVNRTPFYDVKHINGHTFYGISVGDDPQSKNIEGHHPVLFYIEEAQTYPRHAYSKSASTRNPKGRFDYIIGVKDGRMDTPYRKMESSSKPRITLGQIVDPNWNEKTRQALLEAFGSEESQSWQNQVLALWGEPTFSVWNLEDISKNMIHSLDMPIIQIFGKDANRSLDDLFILLPPPKEFSRRIIGVDVGYTSCTSIVIFQEEGYHWELLARVEMREKVDPGKQEEVLIYLLNYYYPLVTAIDSTDGMGLSIALALTAKGYNIQQVFFNSSIITGYTAEGEEIKEGTKDFATLRLRKSFSNHLFHLGYDETILAEFDKEFARKVGDKTHIVTPDNVHIPDSMRCFEIGKYYVLEYQEPKQRNVFILPEIIESFWSTSYM